MKIRDLKAVIVDDAAVKSIHIERALQFCGVENIVMFDHQEALWEYLETSEADCECPLYLYQEVSVNGKEYLLVQGGLNIMKNSTLRRICPNKGSQM